MTTNPQSQLNDPTRALHMAIELSAATWKLAFADLLGRNPRVRTVDAGDLRMLSAEIRAAKRAFKLDPDTSVVSCYELAKECVGSNRARKERLQLPAATTTELSSTKSVHRQHEYARDHKKRR